MRAEVQRETHSDICNDWPAVMCYTCSLHVSTQWHTWFEFSFPQFASYSQMCGSTQHLWHPHTWYLHAGVDFFHQKRKLSLKQLWCSWSHKWMYMNPQKTPTDLHTNSKLLEQILVSQHNLYKSGPWGRCAVAMANKRASIGRTTRPLCVCVTTLSIKRIKIEREAWPWDPH